ncbi:MAG: peptide ABC transporter substrate-binding protein, partial [Marinitoga sp. 4572_148]
IRDVRIVLEKNDKFFGPAPKVDKVVITFYESAATLRLALETGQIDIAFRHLDPRDISDLENNPAINVIKGSSPQIRYLVLNTKQAPFSDPLVRKAIMYAVDRQRIVDDVFVGLAQPLYSMVPMGMWSHKDIFPERNLSAAKRLLQQAGYWTDKPLTIDLWYSPTHYGTTEADVAQVLKESLEETGIIKINIKYAEWSTYVDYFLNGTMGLFLLGWYPDYIDPDDYLWPFLSINGAKSMGSFYENPTTEAIMKAARICVNQEARSELYAQTQNHLVVDVPNIPLWQGVAVVATQKNIKGVLLEPTQIFRYYLIEKK